MTEQEARDVITRVVGIMDRPWDTRAAYALWCIRNARLFGDPSVPQVEAAVSTLGYPLDVEVSGR